MYGIFRDASVILAPDPMISIKKAKSTPSVNHLSDAFARVSGIFYRAIDPAYLNDAIAGSRSAGRYSSSTQPTLYLSSSPEGVEAAMMAHRGERTPTLEVVRIAVEAAPVFDLRDESARQLLGVALSDAIAPWQEVVAKGQTPSSWRVRDRICAQGGVGLIDPSRKAPGLWHLVLFAWNEANSEVVVKTLGAA